MLRGRASQPTTDGGMHASLTHIHTASVESLYIDAACTGLDCLEGIRGKRELPTYSSTIVEQLKVARLPHRGRSTHTELYCQHVFEPPFLRAGLGRAHRAFAPAAPSVLIYSSRPRRKMRSFSGCGNECRPAPSTRHRSFVPDCVHRFYVCLFVVSCPWIHMYCSLRLVRVPL